MPGRSFRIGKIPPEALSKIVFSHLGNPNPRMLLGPGVGRDFAALKYDRLFILTTDPVTGTSRQIGQHSVHINANDIAVAGAKPVWYMCTILLPFGTKKRELSEIMKGIDTVCHMLGITVVRGHTEITRGLDRPIIVGFMIGERKGRLLKSEDVRIGDRIVMTKTAGIEATAILASDFADRLKKMPDGLLSKARRNSNQIGILREALAISNVPGLRVMHDPTEGGVLNACWELAASANLGVEIWGDKIPIAPETREICSSLGLDPLKIMSSGCLLAVVSPRDEDRVVKTLQRLPVRVSTIGTMRSRRSGRRYSLKGESLELRAVPQDELYSLA